MKIQAIASDFDGTILRPGEMQVREELFSAITKMREKGIEFVAASGRQYFNLKRLMKPVAEEISYVCENGALVVCHGEIIHKSVIDRGTALELLEDLEKIPETDIAVSGEDTCYVSADNEAYVEYLQKRLSNHITIISEYKAIRRDMIKISIHWNTGIPEEEAMRFRQKYGDRLQIADGGNGWLDFNRADTSKATALRILAEKKGFELENTVSIGDSENDVAMLQETGYSYVMNTAKDDVKAAANEISYDAVETISSLL